METIAIKNFNRYYEDLTAEELIVKYYQTYKSKIKAGVPRYATLRPNPGINILSSDTK